LELSVGVLSVRAEVHLTKMIITILYTRDVTASLPEDNSASKSTQNEKRHATPVCCCCCCCRCRLPACDSTLASARTHRRFSRACACCRTYTHQTQRARELGSRVSTVHTVVARKRVAWRASWQGNQHMRTRAVGSQTRKDEQIQSDDLVVECVARRKIGARP
jgi:hypothetical protein